MMHRDARLQLMLDHRHALPAKVEHHPAPAEQVRAQHPGGGLAEPEIRRVRRPRVREAADPLEARPFELEGGDAPADD